jgi:predicted GIY-YIG superfamily endonuclease
MHSTGPGTGTVYLIHLDTPYKHARHYTGWTTDLDARLQAHRNGQGARLMQVITQAGITWRLARTWPGGRSRERAIKDRHEAPRLCPECTAPPRPVSTGRSAILPAPAHRVLAATTPVPPPPLRPDPYQSGIRMGEQFITDRAGWTAQQLLACHEYVTGPFRERARHTPAEQEWFRGYTEPITRRIAQLVTPEPCHALDSDSEHGPQAAGGTP